MPAAQPQRQRVPSREPHPAHRIYGLEATGLLIVALLILALTLIRYWDYIPWSAR